MNDQRPPTAHGQRVKGGAGASNGNEPSSNKIIVADFAGLRNASPSGVVLLPNDVGAERDLLLLIQVDEMALESLLNLRVLVADDFYRNAHQDFWRCVEWAMAQRKGYDPRLVYDEWQRRIPPGRYDSGTFSDLTSLTPAMGQQHNHSAPALAQIIVEKALERAPHCRGRGGGRHLSERNGAAGRPHGAAEGDPRGLRGAPVPPSGDR